jgi:hypothetical protein
MSTPLTWTPSRVVLVGVGVGVVSCLEAVAAQGRSKRSRFMTLCQAATKSWTNLSCESAQA